MERPHFKKGAKDKENQIVYARGLTSCQEDITKEEILRENIFLMGGEKANRLWMQKYEIDLNEKSRWQDENHLKQYQRKLWSSLPQRRYHD